MIKLFTDSDTDVTPEVAKKYGYELISMPYIIDGKIIFPYKDYDKFDAHEYYQKLRDGLIPSTSAINTYEYVQYFEPVFKAGYDILYVRFTAKMSRTFQNMNEALEILKEKYPDRKFYEVDTLGITIMSYSIACEIGQMVIDGKSIDEILVWANNEVKHFATYFFADDLKFFRRSGRVSGLKALFGTLAGIKPIIYISNDGSMETIGKERGRIKAIKRLASYVSELGDDLENHTIYIAHSDNLELAINLKNILLEQNSKLKIEIVVVNPTCGAHCGPDCVGVAFHAIHR